MDTWWQTETGAHMIAPLPRAMQQKPGSAALPFFGVSPAIVDEKGNVLQTYVAHREALLYPTRHHAPAHGMCTAMNYQVSASSPLLFICHKHTEHATATSALQPQAHCAQRGKGKSTLLPRARDSDLTLHLKRSRQVSMRATDAQDARVSVRDIWSSRSHGPA
eukprot:1162014-Pelagomonas_calceolata.AAC.6